MGSPTTRPDRPDPKEELKRLEEQKRGIEESKRVLEEWRKKQEIYQQVRRFGKRYEIVELKFDDQKALDAVDGALASSKTFQTYRDKQIKAHPYYTMPGMARDVIVADYNERNPAKLTAAERADLEARIREGNFDKLGSFTLAGGRLNVQMEVTQATNLYSFDGHVKDGAEASRHSNSGTEDTRYGKETVTGSGRLGNDETPYGGEIKGETEKGQSHTSRAEQGRTHGSSTENDSGSTRDRQEAVLRATIITPDGSRTVVNLGVVEVDRYR